MNGRKFDMGKIRFSLVPLEPMLDVIKVLEAGTAKYGTANWKKVSGGEVRYLDAAMRHLVSHMSGEKEDPETSLPHLAHAICSLLFALWFSMYRRKRS